VMESPRLNGIDNDGQLRAACSGKPPCRQEMERLFRVADDYLLAAVLLLLEPSRSLESMTFRWLAAAAT